MVVLAFIHGLSVSYAFCLLESYLKVPSLGCARLGDGRHPPQKGAFGLLFSPFLYIFKDTSVSKRYLMMLSNLHLTSDLKTIALSKSSRFPALLDNLCLPISEQKRRLKVSLHRPLVHPGVQNGLFCLALHVYKQNWRAFPLNNHLVLLAVLCFLNRMFLLFSPSLNWPREITKLVCPPTSESK